MIFEQLVSPDSVLCNAQARSKKHCLEIISELLAHSSSDIAHEEIFARLTERERLGCTSLTDGVAFPHCRVDGLQTSAGALIRLAEPVDFDALDGMPVDVVFGLMVPAEVDESHVADITELSHTLRDASLAASLRAATTSRDLYDALLAGQATTVAKIDPAHSS